MFHVRLERNGKSHDGMLDFVLAYGLARHTHRTVSHDGGLCFAVFSPLQVKQSEITFSAETDDFFCRNKL